MYVLEEEPKPRKLDTTAPFILSELTEFFRQHPVTGGATDITAYRIVESGALADPEQLQTRTINTFCFPIVFVGTNAESLKNGEWIPKLWSEFEGAFPLANGNRIMEVFADPHGNIRVKEILVSNEPNSMGQLNRRDTILTPVFRIEGKPSDRQFLDMKPRIVCILLDSAVAIGEQTGIRILSFH